MRIEGSVRSNLIAAVASARRWRGRPVHKDTVDHWHRLLDYGRLVARQPCGEALSDLVTELEAEMVHVNVRPVTLGRRRAMATDGDAPPYARSRD